MKVLVMTAMVVLNPRAWVLFSQVTGELPKENTHSDFVYVVWVVPTPYLGLVQEMAPELYK